ncbi:hypothetical protein SAG0169_02760 [Streptococcus agalactiae LDS 610]|nr:hypothetical protein SAG0169_02760 [Streptococcus agalactiae LDS 610]
MYIPQFNPRVRKSKKSKKFYFEIRDNKGRTVACQSGFNSKREAENAALEIQQKLRQGYTLDRHTSLYEWFQTWYDLKILPKKKYLKKQKRIIKHMEKQSNVSLVIDRLLKLKQVNTKEL